MKILIFGATGKTGKILVEESLKRGFEVSVFIRNPKKLNKEYYSMLKVYVGDVTNSKDFNQVSERFDALISVLGHTRGGSPCIQEIAIKNILKLMKKVGSKRFVDLTGAGVYFEGDRPGIIDNIFTSLLRIIDPERISDGEKHVELIKSSDVNWTIVRVPVLTNTKRLGYKVGMVGDFMGFPFLSRYDLSDFILDILNDSKYYKKSPYVISHKKD